MANDLSWMFDSTSIFSYEMSKQMLTTLEFQGNIILQLQLSMVSI